MFEVLVYVFSRYVENDAQIDQDTLKKELIDAGFGGYDVEDAFAWITQLEEMAKQVFVIDNFSHDNTRFRIFTPSELKKLSLDSINFLLLLERTKVLGLEQRELAIDRAMALPQREINVDEMRWIVQWVLWSFDRSIIGHERLNQYVFVKNAIYPEELQSLH